MSDTPEAMALAELLDAAEAQWRDGPSCSEQGEEIHLRVKYAIKNAREALAALRQGAQPAGEVASVMAEVYEYADMVHQAYEYQHATQNDLSTSLREAELSKRKGRARVQADKIRQMLCTLPSHHEASPVQPAGEAKHWCTNCLGVDVASCSLNTPAQPAGEGLKKHLQAYADSEYCKGVEVLRREQCLGEEYKLAKGIFGQEELEAHREAARHFGAEVGIYHALKTFVPHPEAPPQASTQGAEEFVLVPKEPTPEMRNAFHAVTDDEKDLKGAAGSRWAAMLAAAPQQKKAEGA